jgi:Ca-activated chloride channel family protein
MRILFGILLCGLMLSSSSATPWREVKRGNSAADSGDADRAQYHYLRALEQGGDTNLVEYNIGNLLYQREDYEKAQQAFMASLDTMQDRTVQSDALYNLANSYFKAEQFEPAVKTYIESLKRNPDDVEAKQNLELALRMMQQQKQQQKQQQQQKGDENKDEQKQDQQEKQQDQKQDQEKQDEQQQKQQEQDQQQEQQEEQQQQQPKPEEMTKEEAEQLLNALMQDEQNALEKVMKAKVQDRKKRERDW